MTCGDTRSSVCGGNVKLCNLFNASLIKTWRKSTAGRPTRASLEWLVSNPYSCSPDSIASSLNFIIRIRTIALSRSFMLEDRYKQFPQGLHVCGCRGVVLARHASRAGYGPVARLYSHSRAMLRSILFDVRTIDPGLRRCQIWLP